MLFQHMPLWLFVVFLCLCFVLKQFTSERFQKSDYYLGQIDDLGWVSALNTKAGLNGLLTFAIFFPFAGLKWSLILALTDAVLHWLSGYYAKRKRLPVFTKEKLLSALTAIRALHAGSYISFIMIVVDWIVPGLSKGI